ncbi:hypothetical protein ACTG18_07350 [Aeromonas hydrophila]|uniref:hypothetical protein n=1 Tax=Aeromonas hydrophila TaxID=644 RepID=UPI003F79F1E6
MDYIHAEQGASTTEATREEGVVAIPDAKKGLLAILVLPTMDQLKYIFSQCGSSFSLSFTI